MSAESRSPADSRLAGTSALTLGLALATAYLVAAALLGAVLLGTAGRPRIAGHPTMLPGPPNSPAPATGTSTTTPDGSAPSTETPMPSSGPSPLPPGYRQVSGPNGLRTVVPAGWPAARLINPGQYQVDDPSDRGPDNSGRFVRYGADAVSGSDLLGDHERYEQEDFAPGHPGYRRVGLFATDHHGLPAVDWEFTWIKDGVPRHVHVLYWQADSTEFNVYASSTQDRWDQTAAIYDAMVAGSTP